jgi:transglutaminase-like putative cysteine protease
MLLVILALGSSSCRPSTPTKTRSPELLPSAERLLRDPYGTLLAERWAFHRMRKAKVGHRHTRIYRLEDHTPVLLWIVSVDHLEVRRFGSVAVQDLTTASLETESGEVRKFAYELQSHGVVNRALGTIQAGRLELSYSGSNAADVAHLAWSQAQGGIFAIERSLQREPMLLGERRVVETYLPLTDRTATVELVAVGWETVDVDGQDQSLLRIEAVDARPDSWKVPTVYWTETDGTIVATHEAFLDRETIAVDRSRATRANDVVQFDFGLDVGVPVDRMIANPLDVRYAVYRVQVDGLKPQDVFPTSLSQHVQPIETGAALITVRQVTPDDPREPELTSDQPRPDDLAPNRLVQSDHPRIRAIANSVAGTVHDPWLAAQLLEQHVHSRLGKADFTQVFSGAAEAAERREGDCSEHAVLLAAVCRARGIPARVAIGLLYSAQQQSFLYHMWNEVWVNGRWIPLDATLGQGRVGGCHLKLRDSSLAEQTAYGLISPVVYLIDHMKIQVVSTQTASPMPPSQ